MKSSSRNQYVVEVREGTGISLNPSTEGSPIRDTVFAVVKFAKDGEVAWTSSHYWKGHEPRSFKATAGKMRGRYQSYYDRTGKRWELEQKAKRDAKRKARDDERKRKQAIRNAAPDLYEVAKIIRPILAKALEDQNKPDLALRTLDAAIAKAEA